jgi:NMD protein affecting ribosome stability and mRNA decay
MKVVKPEKVTYKIRIGNLKPGSCFSIDGEYFILAGSSIGIVFVNLETGGFHMHSTPEAEDMLVIPQDAKVVIFE